MIIINGCEGWSVTVAKAQPGDVGDGSKYYLANVDHDGQPYAVFRLERDTSDRGWRGRRPATDRENRWTAVQVHGEPVNEHQANESEKDTLRSLAEAVLDACEHVERAKAVDIKRAAQQAEQAAAEAQEAAEAHAVLLSTYETREAAYAHLSALQDAAVQAHRAHSALEQLLDLTGKAGSKDDPWARS